jgi:hypothetical protein
VGRKYHLRIHRSQYFATRLQFVGADTGLPGCHRGAGGRWFCGCPAPNRILLQEGIVGDEDRDGVNYRWNFGYRISDCLQTYMVTRTEVEGTSCEDAVEQCEYRAAAIPQNSCCLRTEPVCWDFWES